MGPRRTRSTKNLIHLNEGFHERIWPTCWSTARCSSSMSWNPVQRASVKRIVVLVHVFFDDFVLVHNSVRDLRMWTKFANPNSGGLPWHLWIVSLPTPPSRFAASRRWLCFYFAPVGPGFRGVHEEWLSSEAREQGTGGSSSWSSGRGLIFFTLTSFSLLAFFFCILNRQHAICCRSDVACPMKSPATQQIVLERRSDNVAVHLNV